MLWLWVLPFLMQAGLLAIVMYSVRCAPRPRPPHRFSEAHAALLPAARALRRAMTTPAA